MLKITITPKTITTNNKTYPRVYLAVATVNLFTTQIFATGSTHTQALNNLIKIIK